MIFPFRVEKISTEIVLLKSKLKIKNRFDIFIFEA